MDDRVTKAEGVRARKRRETRHRIAEEGLKLFVAQGYDGTTLDAVAAAAGVSPRTLFYYFKTKDEILHYWKGGGFLETLRATLRSQSTDQEPLQAVRASLIHLMARYETEQTVVVDRILNSTEALRLRKQASFIDLEQTVFSLLCELWPQPERRPALRIAAMIGIGTMRLAMEARRADETDRSLVDHLRDAFALLDPR